MTANPNSESEDVRESAAEESPRTPTSDEQETTRAAAPAAEVLPTPAAPKLSTEYQEDSIVNLDYLEEDGQVGDLSYDEMLALINQYEETLTDIQEGQILQGTVIEVRDNEVLLNIGFKSEGVIGIEEFGSTTVAVGDAFDVFLEKLENQDGLVVLSKERADFLKVWDKIKVAHEAGDVVTGSVDRRIKGGLVVKLWGVDTFLPGSQVALRQVPNLEDMIGEEIQCRIIKKNKRRRNVVVSRRIVLEQEREEKKRTLISELEKGQVRTGVVKNITDFGAFVDLGGIDGLLHITDLSWGRVNHPSEVVAIGQEIEVKVLDFEQERERISLGLKQLQSYPWDNVEEKYPEESIVRGRVVSITNYGAFVELERGVEGLIHISEMSWTRHIKHPSKVVSIGDEVDVMVLKIDKDNEKISLGLKQCESDPWLTLIERYPVGSHHRGQGPQPDRLRRLRRGRRGHRRTGAHLGHELDQARAASQGDAQARRQRAGADPGHRHRQAPDQPGHQADARESLADAGRGLPRGPHPRGYRQPHARPRRDRGDGRGPRGLRAHRSPGHPQAGQAPVLLQGRREGRPEGDQDGRGEPPDRPVHRRTSEGLRRGCD